MKNIKVYDGILRPTISKYILWLLSDSVNGSTINISRSLFSIVKVSSTLEIFKFIKYRNGAYGYTEWYNFNRGTV